MASVSAEIDDPVDTDNRVAVTVVVAGLVGVGVVAGVLPAVRAARRLQQEERRRNLGIVHMYMVNRKNNGQ